jgi:hypothetical protein
MRKSNIKNISVILFFITAFFMSACGQSSGKGGKDKTVS